MNKEQEVIYNELISKYNFDEDQKVEIKLGLESDVDVNVYSKPE